VRKSTCQKKHFKRRATERFGLDINKQIQKEIIARIKKNQTVMLFKQSNRVSHYLITYKGVDFVVVYDRHRGNLVTALEYNEEKYSGLAKESKICDIMIKDSDD